MEIFTNCLLYSIPEAHSFGEVETQSVVRERESYSGKREEIGRMQRAVHIVINSRNHRHLKMIPSEDLRWLVDVNVSLFPVLVDMVLDFVEVNIRRPTVDVNNGQEQVLCRYHHFPELLLQMLGAP